MKLRKYQQGDKVFRPGREVSTIYDIPSEYTPTIDDLANFTAGFETFRPDIYQLNTSDGTRSQSLTGFGFADSDSLDLARQGKMAKEVALARLKNRLKSEYSEWSRLLPEFNKLPESVKLALVDTSYNGKGVAGTIKSSPNLVKSIRKYNGDVKSIVKNMDHSKSANGWLGIRSAARRAMALGKYKWNWREVDKYGRQIDSSVYQGPQDWKASPYYKKYQKGGIVYTPFIAEENDIDKNFDFYQPSFNLSPRQSSYPVIPVQEVTEQVTTKPIVESPIVETQVVESPVIEEPIKESKISVRGANNDNLNYINSQLSKAGMGKNQRAAVLATIVAESGGNPKAIGDGGLAHGLFQWHPDRYKAGEDLDSQINLILSELNDVKGLGWLGKQSYKDTFNGQDLKASVDSLTKRFIRPANGEKESNKRYNIAQEILKQIS